MADLAGFAPYVAAGSAVRGGPDVTVTLPDPPRAPGEPVVRAGVARYAGGTLVLVPLVPAPPAASVLVHAPVTGPVRRVTLPAPLPGLPGVDALLEVAPLPFGARDVLRRLPGLPTFYLALPGLGVDPADDLLLAAGEPVASASAAWVGALLDDRMGLAPAAVTALVTAAMSGVEPPADVAAWATLAALDAPGRALRVVDHSGRPASGYRFGLTDPTGSTQVTTDGAGMLPLPPGAVELRWQAHPGGAAAGTPLLALYERALADPADTASSPGPGRPLTVPPSAGQGHLQVLDASRWFADPPPGLDPGLGRVHPGSRLEPLVDGLAAFAPLLADLRAATGAGCGAHFAGWAFNDFPLDPADPEGSRFTSLVRALDQGGGPGAQAAGARFLMDRFFVFRDDAPVEEIRRAAVLLLVAGVDVLIIADLLEKLETDERGFLALMSLATLAGVVVGMIAAGTVTGALEDAIDYSEDLHAELNGIQPGIALRARHPGRFADNPLARPSTLPLEPQDFLAGVSSWHQKFQVVRRAPDPLGGSVVGYLGGIDVNRNRLDSPGHHGSAWRPPEEVALSPAPAMRAFHDVHARITGPAAADVALTFERRWALDTALQPPRGPGDPAPLDVAFGAPTATDPAVPAQPARHLVQVCRSGYAPAPGSASVPLPWSPQGETTIAQAVVRAISSAREYIYVEDQYFTPHDAYVAALLDAAVREPSLRLLIVIPSGSDQLFGDIRRRELFELLRTGRPGQAGYGERMVVAAPMRRPVLGDAGRVASRGRLVLQDPLSVSADQVLLGPRSRLPADVPFWLWVAGERMLAVERRDDVLSAAGVPSRRYLVRRSGGTEPLWGATPRAHEPGAPVTLAQLRGIYVHTKAVMVDDVFVGIGSCNTNRRGFFSDGEITAFAVPERLKAARENPALALRTALWAEHLGIPPAMGRALLADPVAGFELFRRSPYLGNRASGFDALGVTPELGFPSERSTPVKMLAAFGLVVADDVVPYVWNTLVEPTSASDPDPVPGPGLGDV